MLDPQAASNDDFVTARSRAWPSRLVTLLALSAIVLGNLLGSWHWVRTNVTVLGGDSAGYLEDSLRFADLLATPSLRAFFQVLTYDDYRPPLLFLAVQPFYTFFGRHEDSAQIFNVLCLAAVIGLTYLLGATLGNRRTGLLAALLVGLLPMMAAMARLFYTEIFLTAMVVLNLLALVRSQHFARRGWSLWWGASLGVGLLIKWTMPIYLVLPVIAQLWGQNVDQWQDFRQHRRRLLLALIGGLVLSTLWFWPSRAIAQQLLLGDGLWLGWFLIATLLLYAGFATPTRTTNFWTALALSGAIASLWYLPHANFAAHLLAEDTARGQESASLLNGYNYLRNFVYLYEQHLGMLAWWIFLPSLLLPWLYRLVRRQPVPRHAALLWGSLLSAFLALSVIDQSNARNLVPLLPGIAVLAALSLRFYPWRLAVAIGALWISVFALQWTLFTFDGMSAFYARTAPLWAMENYAAPPASRSTSPQYAIQADVLTLITGGQTEKQRLGILIHGRSLHRGSFRYYIGANRLNAEVVPLTSELSRGWYDTLSAPWVLVKDGSDHDISPPAQDVMRRILAGDPIFHTLYQEVKRYPLPNHETAYLYHRSRGPGRPLDLPLQLAETLGVADAVRAAWSPYSSLIYANPSLAVWVGIHDPARERVTILPDQDALPANDLETLTDTLLVVWNYEATALKTWFDAHAFRTYEVGNDFASVAVYGRPTQPLQPIVTDAAWGDFRMTAVTSLPHLHPGEVLPLTFQVAGDLPAGVKLSLRLLDAQQTVLASHDRPLQMADRLGLFIPTATSPGEYTVVAIVYDEASLLPLPDQRGTALTELFTLTVLAP